MTTHITEISNDFLARLFFRRLWQSYDSGGISARRSLQSSLVEAHNALNQYDYLPDLPFGLREFAEEADKRVTFKHRQTLLGSLEDLSIISRSDISLLCIEALRIWYQIHKDEIHSQGYVANRGEGKFVDSICKIIPIPIFPHIKSDADIIKISLEADNRVRIKFTDNNLSCMTSF